MREVIDREETLINLSYVVEPECFYETNVTQLLNKEKIMLHEGSELDEFYEIGCQVKVRWSKEELGDSGWRSGWYIGEVQQSDPDNDVIKVVFQAQPTHTKLLLVWQMDVCKWLSQYYRTTLNCGL